MDSLTLPGSPFCDQEKGRRKPCNPSNKKSRMNEGFGKTRTPAHTALVVLTLKNRLLITRYLLFSCGSSAGYIIGFSNYNSLRASRGTFTLLSFPSGFLRTLPEPYTLSPCLRRQRHFQEPADLRPQAAHFPPRLLSGRVWLRQIRRHEVHH